MRVLVTGAAGYLGRAAIEQLRHAGCQVAALARRDVALPDVEVRRGDLLHAQSLAAALNEVEAVVHLAALSRGRESVEHPAHYYAVNVGGTAALLDALARRAEPAQFVLASTGAVYGTPSQQPIAENAALDPPNPYAASKVAAEDVTRLQAATGSVGAAVLRIFNAAGAVGEHGDPDETRIITRAVAVAAGRVSHVDVNGDGSAVRDFVHVHDVATALVLALQGCEPGTTKTLNVGATPASVAEIVRIVEEVTGRPVPVKHRPANPHEAPELRADTTRIRTELGWRPERSDLARIVADQWAAERASISNAD
jgi:UDP-glucose 4-epimerase